MKIIQYLVIFATAFTTAFADNWPSWRGNLAGSGETMETDIPLEWGKDKNVKWRVELPERGNSTPIVWDDKIFVTQAIDGENWRGLMCFHREDGRQLWKNGIIYEKEERTHRDNPYCSASPSTDGSVVIAAYGSAGVVGYDMAGKELWKRDFGAIDHAWGNSTSPVIKGDLCFHYHGPSKGAVLYALNKLTGETVWKWNEPDWQPGERTDGFRERSAEGIIGSFSTPIIVNQGGKDLLIMSFPMELKAFDPETGKIAWTVEGLNPLVYTSPIASDEIIVAMGGYYGNSIGASTNGERLWQEVRHFGGIGTGVVKDGYLYVQNSGSVIHCVEMATGKTLWKDRLPGAGKSWGSLILSGDHIYSLSQPGDSVVFRASPERFEAIAQSNVGERTNSSLVVSDGEIFIRTYEALWCIAKE